MVSRKQPEASSVGLASRCTLGRLNKSVAFQPHSSPGASLRAAPQMPTQEGLSRQRPKLKWVRSSIFEFRLRKGASTVEGVSHGPRQPADGDEASRYVCIRARLQPGRRPLWVPCFGCCGCPEPVGIRGLRPARLRLGPPPGIA